MERFLIYATRFRVIEPDYSYLPEQNFDWTHTVYGHVQECIPHDMPDPLGQSDTTTTTVDANLNRCLATGWSLKRNLPLILGGVKNVMKGYCPPTSMGLPITLSPPYF